MPTKQKTPKPSKQKINHTYIKKKIIKPKQTNKKKKPPKKNPNKKPQTQTPLMGKKKTKNLFFKETPLWN